MEYKGYDYEIKQDIDPINPRTEWDNMDIMVCFHSRYNLGDKHDFSDEEEFIQWAKDQGDKIEILPLYLYDHSGITMSTGSFSCGWDSGQVGWIYTDLEQLNKMGHNWKRWSKKRRKQVREWMISSVDTYDNLITGSVYGYEVTLDGEYIDSCWGFFGYDHEESGLMEYAKNAIDCDISHKIKEHTDKVKQWIRSGVPLEYRKSFAA